MSIFFWLAAHWWILAILAALALIAALWGGFVSIAAIVKAALAIAAEIAKFFAKPADQIAAKILLAFIAAVLGISAGYYYGTFSERATWKAREAAHAAAMERIKNEAKAQAQQEVEQATAEERTRTAAANKRLKDYEDNLPKAPAGDCRIDDDDLRAAGDVPRANRADVRHRSKRLQRLAPHR
jgi:signal transduction histidine kinase